MKPKTTSSTSAEIAAFMASKGHPLSPHSIRFHLRDPLFPRDPAGFWQHWQATVGARKESAAQGRDAKHEKTMEEVRRLKLINAGLEEESQIRRRELVPKSEINQDVAAACARIKGMLTAAFVTELPAKQNGRPADQIAAMNEAEINRIMREIYTIGAG